MPLWHKHYFRLVIFKKQWTQEQLCKPSRSYSSVRDIYIYKKSPFVRVFPSLYQKEEDTQNLQKHIISVKGNDLNLCNNLTLIYCAFPDSLPSLAPQHLVFSWTVI